jgi:hypothetical protein
MYGKGTLTSEQFQQGEIYPITDHTFSVKVPGLYTVFAEDADGRTCVTQIRIGRWKFLFVLIFVVLIAILAAGCVPLINQFMQINNNCAKTASTVSASSERSKAANSKKPNSGYGSAKNGTNLNKSRKEILAELEKQQVVVTDKVSSYMQVSKNEKGAVTQWAMADLKNNNVQMQAEIYYQNKLYAESAVVAPGEHINSVTLINRMPKGKYKAIAYINYYSTDKNQKYLGKAGYVVNISVK